jgi:hypothetical protein
VEIEPLTSSPVRIPPGRVAIRLDERHKSAYRDLYARYRTVLDGLPVLRERDFDGRAVKVTPAQLEALNRAFASLSAAPLPPANVFDAQERSRQRLFKLLQYLS